MLNVESWPRRTELLFLGAPLAHEHLRVVRDAHEETLANAVLLLARAKDDKVNAKRHELDALELGSGAKDLVVDAKLRGLRYVEAHEKAANSAAASVCANSGSRRAAALCVCCCLRRQRAIMQRPHKDVCC